jgi:hypothetical protein
MVYKVRLGTAKYPLLNSLTMAGDDHLLIGSQDEVILFHTRDPASGFEGEVLKS